MRLRITYGSAAVFLDDFHQQVEKGGLLVRVQVEAAQRDEKVDLEVVTPAGSVQVSAQVIQHLGENGVAVSVDPTALAALVALAEASPDGGDGKETRFEVAGEESEPSAGTESLVESAAARAGREQAQRIQQALHGDKNARMTIIRGNNKLLHTYVLRNPKIQLDEIASIARMRTVAVDILTFIASKRDWAERPEIALALVRNPKTPVPLATKMLDHVNMSDLRQLSKQASVKEALQRAVRKKILR